MNVMLYALKRDFEVQKAERYFKERRIPYTFVDLKKHRLGAREIELFAGQVGLDALIDKTGRAFAESAIRFSSDKNLILEALMAQPALLRAPIVRNGRQVSVGFAPDVWAGWK